MRANPCQLRLVALCHAARANEACLQAQGIPEFALAPSEVVEYSSTMRHWNGWSVVGVELHAGLLV